MNENNYVLNKTFFKMLAVANGGEIMLKYDNDKTPFTLLDSAVKRIIENSSFFKGAEYEFSGLDFIRVIVPFKEELFFDEFSVNKFIDKLEVGEYIAVCTYK